MSTRWFALALLLISLSTASGEEPANPADYSIIYQPFSGPAEHYQVRPGEEVPAVVHALLNAPNAGVEMVTDLARGPHQTTPIGPMVDLRPEYGLIMIPRIEARTITAAELASLRNHRLITLYRFGNNYWIQSTRWDPVSYWYVETDLDLGIPAGEAGH